MTVAYCDWGEVTGSIHRNAHVFLGLPYAEAPVGELRWLPPQTTQYPPAQFDARNYPARCPQPPYPEILGNVPSTGALNEDCLYLNVYTPAPDAGNRPVMFWIHGGGYIVGSANDFDASALAVENDVVVVCINYRLGIFGYLDLEEFGDQFKGSANLGCQDQIAALNWVKNNIAAFGGDPENITIFGESAGGGSVLALLAAPSAKGLFHKAIAMSPGPVTFPPHDNVEPLANHLETDRANIFNQLQAMSGGKLCEIQLVAGLYYAASVDGTVITKPAHRAVTDSANLSVPLLLGTTRDEGTLLAPMMDYQLALAELPRQIVLKEDAGDYIRHIEETHDSPAQCLEQIVTDMFRSNVLRVARASSQPAWVYRFDLPSTVMDGALGATHGSTTPFTFNAYDANLEMLCKFHDKNDPAIRTLSRTWSGMLARFARTGNPNGDGLPQWEPYDVSSRSCLLVEREMYVVNDPDAENRRQFAE